ncbi:MAG: hypothetical protein QWI73_06730, partial [Alphaproteobacteria bacterium]|nr:hypothetical protein [Alphaproteobacteria bacterium]
MSLISPKMSFSRADFSETTTSIQSLNTRFNSDNRTSSNWRNRQQRPPNTFNSRFNSCVEQTPRFDTNNRVNSSITPARNNPIFFPHHRRNSDNIFNNNNSTSTNTNTITASTFETRTTEILDRLNDLRLQISNLNLTQQTTLSSTSSPSQNSTQLPTPTSNLTTTTISSTNTIFTTVAPSASTTPTISSTNTIFTTVAPSTSETTPTLPPSLTDVIQHYQCPFENNPELLCTYYERHTEDGVCPFGHQLNAFNNGIELTQLPMHLCLNYLLN